MSGQKPKVGKKGAIQKIAKELAELRNKPISSKVHDVVRENFERPQQQDKRAAKSSGDLEV